jgi:Zinc carboxypeptidase/Cytosolic carboxypeptidase N-terminal domain
LQWYYFEVKNTKASVVTFKIINLGKYESLYNEGMKPLTKSLKAGNEWVRAGHNILYTPNYQDSSYTLTFSYKFTYEQDTVYFAYSYPYTYEDLLSDLSQASYKNPEICRINSICETICGNSCHMVTITNNISTYNNFYEEKHYCTISTAQRKILRRRKSRIEGFNEHAGKKGVFITSRVHPGETVGSFMMQGVLEFLTSDCREAVGLRKQFVFKLVPMLNPDGVRYGKTRSSMLGVDLNRRWLDPNPVLHPTIYYTKKHLQVFSETHECLLFCDLHGHSIKRNVFFYGCNLNPLEPDQAKKNIMAKLIPFILSKKNKLVSYKDSKFRMQKSKESTARIVAYKQLGIINSLTIEASFYGPSDLASFKDSRDDYHMTLNDLKSVGRDLCLVCLGFVSPYAITKNLISLSNYIRGTKSVKSVNNQNPIEGPLENNKFLIRKELQSEIINNVSYWDNIVVNDIDYLSENSDPSDASANNEDEKIEFFEPKKVPNRKNSKSPSYTRFNKKNLHPKIEKKQLTPSPEAYFKVGGISVFSLNNKAKSSENFFKIISVKNINPAYKKKDLSDRPRTTDKKWDVNSSKITIFNNKAFVQKAELKHIFFKNKPEIIQAESFTKSRTSLVSKTPDIKKKDRSEVPLILIKKAKIHLISQKS